MDDAKLRLSAAEMALVMDPEVILTKNSIIGKVVGMMARLSEAYREVLEMSVAEVKAADGVHTVVLDAVAKSPKISKGENYQGLPYVMLDYPRIFGKEDVLAIRTMFWWGHAFSTTLHLKGSHQGLYLPVIRARWAELAAAGFHIGVSEDEWRHDHVPENYLPMEGPPEEGGPPGEGERSFLKLSARCGLDQWEKAPTVLTEHFRLLVGVLVP